MRPASLLPARVIRDNPAAGHHIKVARQRGQVLPLDQLLRLVENTRADYRLAVLVLVYTGMRPSELCGLRVRRLDLFKGTVHVCETLTPVGNGLVAGTTKTDQHRSASCPAGLRTRSPRRASCRAGCAVGRALSPEDYVFVSVKGAPLNRDFLRKHVLVPALRAAGPPVSFRTYDLNLYRLNRQHLAARSIEELVALRGRLIDAMKGHLRDWVSPRGVPGCSAPPLEVTATRAATSTSFSFAPTQRTTPSRPGTNRSIASRPP